MTDTTDLIQRLRACVIFEREGQLMREAAAALEQQAAQIAALRAALEWYADEARACEKNSKAGGYSAGEALVASVTVLALDGGKRADAALRQEQPKPLVEIGRRTTPCGECHLQPGERCDICGARDVSEQPAGEGEK